MPLCRKATRPRSRFLGSLPRSGRIDPRTTLMCTRLRVEVADRSPKRCYGKRRQSYIEWGGGPWANRATTAVEFVGTSNKSECTRESTLPGACLAVSRTAHGAGETHSTMRRCVPQPSAIAPSEWWTWSGSNRRPLPCHGSALPAAPQAHSRKKFPRVRNSGSECGKEPLFIFAYCGAIVNARTCFGFPSTDFSAIIDRAPHLHKFSKTI